MNNALKWIISIILILSCKIIASELPELSNMDAGWQELAQNKFDEAESFFQKAIRENESNPRPYLALSFMMQLKDENEKAWEWYAKALDNLDNRQPYIFSAMLTKRGLLFPVASINKGIINILPEISENADYDGILRAGALGRLGKYHEEYGELDDAKEYFKKLGTIDQWTLIGPFENISASGFDNVFEPELEYHFDRELEGKHGIPAKWFKVDHIRHDRWIDFTRYFAQKEAIYYGNTFIYSSEKQTAQVRVGTSGSVKVFLNDEPVISCADENNNDLDTYIAETQLQKGWNRLLIKCGFSEITQCNFLVRITDQKGYALEDLDYSTEPNDYISHPNAPVKLISNFAEIYFNDLIKKNPQHIENYLLLADCYLRNDKAIEAELVLQKAAEKMPDCVLIKSQLLEAYIRGEKYDEISSTIARIFELYPDVPFVLEQKFTEYGNSENVDQMEEIVNRYVKLLPNHAIAYIMQMTVALKKGQFEKGLAILNEAYHKYPTNWEIAYLSALFSVRTTQSYEGAIKIYNDFLNNRRTENAFIQLGDIYYKASKIDKYEEIFNELIKQDPAAVGIYFSLSTVFHQLQNDKKAEQYIKKCLEICPNHSLYWSKLGEIKQASGDKAEAIQAYRKALDYSATDYNSRLRLRELEGKGLIFDQFESIDINALIKNAPKADKYPNDGAVFLLDDNKRVVYHRGASELQNEILIKVFNTDGIDDFKEYWLPSNSKSETLIVEKAVVIKLDGTEVKADINYNQLVFKSLEPNEFIYIKWRAQNYHNGRLSPHIWDEIHFNYFYPIEKIKYSLLVPNDFQFNHKTQNMQDTPIVKESPDGRLYEWSLNNQPAVIEEYNMPDLDDVGQMLFISSIPTWEYLVDWYLDLAKTKTRSSYEIKKTVMELLKSKPDANELDKINLIYNFITDNISYSSVSFRQSGLIPQKARNVLVQRIGDCKDVATLCIAMLKEANISAHYVLVNTFDEGQNKNILPAIEFNHVIVGAETKQGIVYMDLTAQNYPLFSIPKNDQDAFALSIIPGTTKPFYLSKKNFSAGITKRVSTIKFDENNNAFITMESQKWGVPGASIRNSYRFKGKEDQRNVLTESLAGEFPNVQVNKFKITNLDEIKENIEYAYEFTVPSYLIDASNMKLLKLPWSDILEARRSLSTEERKFDYLYRANSDTLCEEMTVYLPEGYEPIDLQKQSFITSEIADYSIELKYRNGVITGNRRFINKMSIIPPDKYSEFKEFYNKAIRVDSQPILLKKRI